MEQMLPLKEDATTFVLASVPILLLWSAVSHTKMTMHCQLGARMTMTDVKEENVSSFKDHRCCCYTGNKKCCNYS